MGAEGRGKVGSGREAEHAYAMRINVPLSSVRAHDPEGALGVLKRGGRLGIGPGVGHTILDQHASDPRRVEPVAHFGTLGSIKSAYEQFHQLAYTDEALRCTVHYASTLVTKGALPARPSTCLTKRTPPHQVRQDKLPDDVMKAMKRIRFIVQRMETSIANHEFEKARFYSGKEKKERLILIELRKKHDLDARGAFTVDRKEIESAVSKITGIPLKKVRQAGGQRSASK